MSRSKEEIEKLTELLFQDCCFDSVSMDASFTKQQFREMLSSVDDETFEWVRHKCLCSSNGRAED